MSSDEPLRDFVVTAAVEARETPFGKIGTTLRIRLPKDFTIITRNAPRPELPSGRQWHNPPQKIGDIGFDDHNERWIWLPTGLKLLEEQEAVVVENDSCDLKFDHYLHIWGRLSDNRVGLRPLPPKPEPPREPPSIDYKTYARLFAVW